MIFFYFGNYYDVGMTLIKVCVYSFGYAMNVKSVVYFLYNCKKQFHELYASSSITIIIHIVRIYYRL